MRIIFILLAAVLFACNHIRSNNSSASDHAIVKTDGNTAKEAQIKTDFTKDSMITIRFPKDSSSVRVLGKLNGINKPVTVFIPVTKADQLTVVLAPEDSAANIRINQVFSPHGKADGPFGRTMTRTITEQGTYQIIIGENLMQGDEWKGKFALTVIVK